MTRGKTRAGYPTSSQSRVSVRSGIARETRAALAQITAGCEELKATGRPGREFADMLRRRREHLEARAARAEASPVSELRGFNKGLGRDWAAVTAGLTVPYSSGAVEGHVDHVKMMSSSFARMGRLPSADSVNLNKVLGESMNARHRPPAPSTSTSS